MSTGINTAAYDYRTYDPTLNRTIAFRKATMDRDLERLHAWFNAEHVLPYWQLNEPLPAVRAAVAEKLDDEHLTPYIGYLDHVPMSYWECYWVGGDELAEYCDTEPADQGIHLLIGPEEYLGRGYAIPLVRAVTEMQFSHPETDRILTEPDIRNDAVIHVFERCGFEPRREIELPEKDALLMVCDRDRFQALGGGREVTADD
ncbi:GNAT family N-acetyltransferase [Halocatena salina]|uniref:Acetyltransferase n=1 Tax=Halocatena salina TaxID=2934340 RepID=A0A8U0A0P9_9EURY|nr:GNAT family N-acetyltransferase [Halocatena salina]UPM42008.1 acetyltransferase [Halocatena salina]